MLRLVGAAVLASLVTTEVTADPYPLDYWARRSAISGVSLSPDGSQFALTRILERGGNPIIELYDSDNLEQDPIRIDSSPMEIMPGVRWIDKNLSPAITLSNFDELEDENGVRWIVFWINAIGFFSSYRSPFFAMRSD